MAAVYVRGSSCYAKDFVALTLEGLSQKTSLHLPLVDLSLFGR